MNVIRDVNEQILVSSRRLVRSISRNVALVLAPGFQLPSFLHSFYETGTYRVPSTCS
jgi:hypothetical protein